MMRNSIAALVLSIPLAVPAFADSGFLADYSILQSQVTPHGTDRGYVSADAFERIANVTGVMVDQPEIHFSPDSEYKGLKPEDVQAIAAILRENLTTKLGSRGYAVVDRPGENVVYIRTALSELYLKKKKRGVLTYTPVGAVVKAGTDALSETLEKVDIIEMSMEAELRDSQSGDILASMVIERGARKQKGQKEDRLDMDEFRGTVQEYAARFACNLDNAKLAETQRIDCSDPAARQAREQAGS